MDCVIRPAHPNEAEAISRVIVATLRETNAKDYSQDVIARVEQSFSPTAVVDLLARRLVLVAVVDDAVVGTASLDGGSVRTVFIIPACQGHGIGRALMAEVERAAIERGIPMLAVPSSVTAEPFYAKLGYRSVRESHHGEERTIVMERRLPDRLKPCRAP